MIGGPCARWIAPGQQARARWRTDRRTRIELAEPHPSRTDRINIGRLAFDRPDAVQIGILLRQMFRCRFGVEHRRPGEDVLDLQRDRQAGRARSGHLNRDVPTGQPLRRNRDVDRPGRQLQQGEAAVRARYVATRQIVGGHVRTRHRFCVLTPHDPQISPTIAAPASDSVAAPMRYRNARIVLLLCARSAFGIGRA